MPFPGAVNNPGGANGTQMFEHESEYGAVKRLTQSVQQAPIAPTPAVNAPRRAQRAAVKRSQPSAPASPQAATPEDYYAAQAQVWAAIASLPGASDLVKQYAARAAAQVNLAPSQ